MQSADGTFVKMSPNVLIRDITSDGDRWAAVGGVGTGSVFTSNDKIKWAEMPTGFGEVETAVYSGGRLHVAVNDEGIYTHDGAVWSVPVAPAFTFTNSVDAKGVPVFGTTDGHVVAGGVSQKVAEGKTFVAFFGSTFYVAALNGETLETFSGPTLQSLTTQGTSTLDGLDLFAFYADAKGVVVGTGKMNADEPIMIILKDGKWTFVFSDMAVPLSHGLNNCGAGGKVIYTTANYTKYTLYHTLDKDITALLYA